jgi:hypothetical protein
VESVAFRPQWVAEAAVAVREALATAALVEAAKERAAIRATTLQVLNTREAGVAATALGIFCLVVLESL